MVVRGVREVLDRARPPIRSVQVPIFPGADEADLDMMISDLKKLGLTVHLVIMMGGGDPMDPADEDATVAKFLPLLETAKRNGVTHVGAVSVEDWMRPGAERRDGEDFEAALEQVVKLHQRVYEEAGLADSCVEAWHAEFLRPGEFVTFTDLGRLWEFVKRTNERLGRPFFRCLVDAAHCGDSALGIEENQRLVAEIAGAGALGVVHASAKTTRGCLSTDDGWVSAMIDAAARSGELRQVFVEIFHHEDDAFEGLRKLDPNHGVDTTDGRDYAQVVADGLDNLARCLNNHAARGHLPRA